MHKRGYAYTAFLFLVMLLFVCPAYAFPATAVERTEYIKTMDGPEGAILILERARASGVADVGMQRVQIRTEEGRVVAYTPSRITAVPFCLTAQSCWVFMWKTVYPLPAIFKFNPDKDTWTNHPHPPMRYTRSGNDGEGFTKPVNPLFGLWGVVLLIFYKAPFFLLLSFLSVILFVQINKFRDLPEIHKAWVRRVLLVITAPLPIPFVPVEPFLLTSALILAGSWFSIDWVGVPSVLSMLMSIIVFFCCSMAAVNLKKRRKILK